MNTNRHDAKVLNGVPVEACELVRAEYYTQTFSIPFLLGSEKALEKRWAKMVTSAGLDKPEEEVVEAASDDSPAEVKLPLFCCLHTLHV